MLGMSIIALLFSLVALFCSIYVDRKAKKDWEEYNQMMKQINTMDFLKEQQNEQKN